MIGHQPLERLTGILAALIGMMPPLLRPASAPDRNDERVRDHLGRHLIAQAAWQAIAKQFAERGPSDNAPREEIDDDRNIEPVLSFPDVGEVGHPFLVRTVRIQLSLKHVGRYDRPRAEAELATRNIKNENFSGHLL